MNQNHVDIACITKTVTWLTDNIPNSVVNISDYTLVRKDQTLDKRGGCVCAYIKSSIEFTTIDEVNAPSFESLWVYIPNTSARLE